MGHEVALSNAAGTPAPNTVLRAWRESVGMSRDQMADALSHTPAGIHAQLTCDEKRIGRWETGHTMWPSQRYRAALFDLTGLDAPSLGFTPPWRTSPASPSIDSHPGTPPPPGQVRPTP
jgi:hypothetical protein